MLYITASHSKWQANSGLSLAVYSRASRDHGLGFGLG
jgi:hypothetical protein